MLPGAVLALLLACQLTRALRQAGLAFLLFDSHGSPCAVVCRCNSLAGEMTCADCSRMCTYPLCTCHNALWQLPLRLSPFFGSRRVLWGAKPHMFLDASLLSDAAPTAQTVVAHQIGCAVKPSRCSAMPQHRLRQACAESMLLLLQGVRHVSTEDAFFSSTAYPLAAVVPSSFLYLQAYSSGSDTSD